MSTYLVAYIVGELEATEAVMVGKTPLRVWCVPGKQGLTRFGRDIGAFSLGYYEEYYGRKYPGDKLDLIFDPRLRGRGDGELRRHHLPRDGPARR